MKVLGEIDVSVQYEQQPPQQLPLVIVEGGGPSLLGSTTLSSIEVISKQCECHMILSQRFWKSSRMFLLRDSEQSSQYKRSCGR